MYDDRTEAGRILGEQLVTHDVRPDVVLAVPSGGVPIARPICDRFGANLGLMVTEPIRAPSPHDLPIGAVTDTGAAWIDDRLVETFDIDEERLDVEKQRAFREARDKHVVYDEVDEDPTPEGTVVVVDDGIVTGRTMKACGSALEKVADCYAVVAAPVGPPDSVAELHHFTDEVVVTETPPDFRVLGQFYDAFERPTLPR
jgi:predicted phosphoribosyltransferase